MNAEKPPGGPVVFLVRYVALQPSGIEFDLDNVQGELASGT